MACSKCGSTAYAEDCLPSGNLEYKCHDCGRSWEVSGEAVEALAELVALPDRAPGQERKTPYARTLASLHGSSSEPGSICIAEVEPEQVEWAWFPYIPLGKLTIIEGNPGDGKSWITAAIGAALSTAGFLPGAPNLGEGKVLYFTAEDGLADTLRPRLDALGADCTKIYGFSEPLDLSDERGLEALGNEIRDRQPMLVFIDPVVAFVGGRTDTYRANQVRNIMAPLAGLAERYRCAIVAVRHLNKARSGRAIFRGQGSIDFTAAARSVLLVGSDPDEPENRGIIHIKCNLARLGDPIGFSLADGRFTWSRSCTLTAEQILGEESTTEGRGAQEEARIFLQAVLADGPKLAREILRETESEGVCSERTLKTAKSKLRVSSEKRPDGWYWVAAQEE